MGGLMDGSAFKGVGDALVRVLLVGAVLLVLFVPLGVWKLLDLIGWAFAHVSISLR